MPGDAAPIEGAAATGGRLAVPNDGAAVEAMGDAGAEGGPKRVLDAVPYGVLMSGECGGSSWGRMRSAGVPGSWPEPGAVGRAAWAARRMVRYRGVRFVGDHRPRPK